MKYSTRVADSVHILAFIHLNPKGDLTSKAIAESIKTNPAFVRQIMGELRDAGLIETVPGHAKPELAKPADRITLLDIYRAVEKDKPLLHLNTHTNPECGVGINIQLALQDFYDKVQKEAEDAMKNIRLQDVLNRFNELK